MAQLEFSEELIARSAPNAAAINNAKKISKGNQFVRLFRTEDDSLLFGECRGSGKTPYRTSVDFSNVETPVYRCSCPSRQFPCKHALALLYDYLAGKNFEVSEPPQDILEKRQKQQQTSEKKQSTAPKKTNQAALTKKLQKQVEGLNLVEQFLSDLLRTGLAAAAAGPIQPYQALAKQLGDYYLPGPQALVTGILLQMKCLQDPKHTNQAQSYQQIIQYTEALYELANKGKEFLNQKISTKQVLPENTMLQEQLGHVWQLEQLKELGLVREDVNLVQLSFHILFDQSKNEWIDTGWWIDMATGELVKTENLRPLRAVKHLKQDDTMLEYLHTPLLYIYPGEKNKRVRWEEATTRSITLEDYQTIRQHAAGRLAAIIKEAKNQIKNPLSEHTIMVLVAYQQIGKVGERFVLTDAEGGSVALENMRPDEDVLNRLAYVPDSGLLYHQVLAGELFYNRITRQFAMQPHAIVSEQQIFRLLY